MLRTQAAESGKPANVLEKMVVGRLNKCAIDDVSYHVGTHAQQARHAA